MSSELPCISMNLTAGRGTRRASSRPSRPVRPTGRTRGTPAFACPRWPPYRTVVSIECNGYAQGGADPGGLAALRRARFPRNVDGCARAGARRAEGLALLADRLEAGAPLRDDARGCAAFHAALDAVPRTRPAAERVRVALRGHLRVVSEQLDVATVFTREWRYLEGEHREEIVAERRRYEERWRALFREGVESGELRTDLDVGAATLLVLSAANWAYTWLEPGRDTDELADRFTAILVDGIRGYATPAVSSEIDPSTQGGLSLGSGHARPGVLTRRGWCARLRWRRLLIVNPFASGVDAHRLAAVQAALPAGTETRITTGRGEATEIAREAAAASTRVYVLGGDGTYNEVLNGLEGDVPLGFLPGGGTSVLPRALGLPRNPVAAAQAGRGGAHAPDRPRARQRPEVRLQRRARPRCRARAPRRRARAKPRRTASRRRRVHEGARVRAEGTPRAVRRAARGRGRRARGVRARRELRPVHVLGLGRARPGARRELRRRARVLVAPVSLRRARPPAPARARRPRIAG